MPKLSRRSTSLLLRFFYPHTNIRVSQTGEICAAYLDGKAEAEFYGKTWNDVAQAAFEKVKQESKTTSTT